MNLWENFCEAERRWPNLTAVDDGGHTVSYKELKSMAIGFAQSGVVEIRGRGLEAYARILGALSAGGVYLPLPARWPEARRASARDGVGRLEGDVAYLLFTSGTTGKPKGIAITHAQVLAYIEAVKRRVDVRPGDRVSQYFDLGFDLSVHDLFVTWTSGACVVTISEAETTRPVPPVAHKKISVWFSTPSVITRAMAWRGLPASAFPDLRESLFCGEALSYEAAIAWQSVSPNARLHNLYGPTEATIAIASLTVEPGALIPRAANGLVPFGRIFAPNEARLSEDGELYLRGPQVITEYHGGHRPEKFENGWYKTGDHVEQTAHGYNYLGRLDDQVKIRGFRAELYEIERVLREASQKPAVCAVWPLSPAPAQMIYAFVQGPVDAKNTWIEKCRESLPEYMVPFDILSVQEFPLNSRGKVDKAALLRLLPD